MAHEHFQAMTIDSIGLNPESFESFSSEIAHSMLRILQDDTSDDRTYSSVSMFQIADGYSLYIHPQ